MTDASQGDALVSFNPASLEVYKDGLAAEVEKVAVEARIRVAGADVATDGGRQTIRSTAYKVAKSKTALDELGAKMVEDQKATVRAVDASRKKMRDQLDVLRDEIRKPLTEFERREEERVSTHIAMLAGIEKLGDVSFVCTAADIQARLDRLNQIPARNWEEFSERFAAARLQVGKNLEALLEQALKDEAEKVELDRLRAEAIARERQDRETKIALDAAERAKREADEEAERKIVLERREREAAEARAQKAEAEVAAARKRELAHELARLKEEQEEEQLAEAIDLEVEGALEAWFAKEGKGLDAHQAAVTLQAAIADGKIPHVSISYS